MDISMKKFSLKTVLSVLLLTLSAVASADVSKAIADKVTAGLSSLMPGVVPDSVAATPVPGLYEVMLGPRLIYVSEDGNYLVQGSLFDLQTRKNITEPRLKQAKANAINAVSKDSLLVFSPPEGTAVKHKVYVFTDIDCGFCRKLHREMAAYNAAGIEISYLFYPRAGIGSESYKKAAQVWCSKDRHAAMDDAKAGKDLAVDPGCANPVEAHYNLGSLLGVSGTPALVLEDGEVVPGYVPADKLSKALDQMAAEK